MPNWKHYRYKNLTLLFFGLIMALLVARMEWFHALLAHLGNIGYFGAFVAGVLFVLSFGAAIGVVIILVLAETYPVLQLGVVAGLGSVVGDYLIFRFVKNRLLKEVEPIYGQLGGSHLTRILHTKYFNWTLPVIGSLIIASPLPDEIGVSMLGIAKMKTSRFILLSFILNSVGIILVILASTVVKP